MPETHHITPRDEDVLILVGTMKGAFIFRADQGRGTWEMGGPYFPGSAVYAMAYDGRLAVHIRVSESLRRVEPPRGR